MVLQTERFLEKAEKAGVVLLRGKAASTILADDLESTAIERSIHKFRRIGFPTYVVYPADSNLRPILLPEKIDIDLTLRALELASGETSG